MGGFRGFQFLHIQRIYLAGWYLPGEYSVGLLQVCSLAGFVSAPALARLVLVGLLQVTRIAAALLTIDIFLRLSVFRRSRSCHYHYFLISYDALNGHLD